MAERTSSKKFPDQKMFLICGVERKYYTISDTANIFGRAVCRRSPSGTTFRAARVCGARQ